MSSPRCLQHVYQSFCTLISLLLNSFLIYLIINKSPKKLGDYKWLMIYTAVFEQVYTLVDLLTEPTAYSYGHSFVVFRRYNATWTNADESQVLILAWCGLFGSSMAVFGVHFVYRFASVHAGTSLLCNKMKSIGKNVLVLFAVPVFYGAWWTIVCIVYCRYTPGTYQYMKNMTKTLYNLNIEDISYISAVFYIDDPVDESIHLNFGSWIALCQFSTMVGSSMFCVGYLGYRCYSELSGQLSMTSNQSQLATSLQKQLYFALVGQTVIPIAFMYLPICVFVFGPVFMVEIGVVSTFFDAFCDIVPSFGSVTQYVYYQNLSERYHGDLEKNKKRIIVFIS